MAEVTVMRNCALPYPVYGLPYVVTFPLLDADGDPISPSSPDSEISKNGDTFADCTNEATEIATSSGSCYLSLTGTELTCDVATVQIKSTGAKTTVLVLLPRKLVSIRAGTSASAGSSTSTIVLDASASAVDDFYNGMIVAAVIDSVTEVRMITDYVGSTQTATVTPDWNTAPDNNDTFTIYRPDGVQVQQANTTHWNSLAVVELPLVPTTAGRKLDVSAGGGAGIDWANVENPTTTLNLSGTTVKTATDVEADTQDIQSRLPAALTGAGNIKADSLAISGSSTAADNAEVVFATDFATNYSTTTDKWQVEANVLQIEGSDATNQIRDSIVDDATRIDASALNTATGTTIPAILDDTDLIDDGTSGLAKIATDVAAILVDTGTTLDGKLNTIDGIVDDILVDTAEIGAAGAGLTAINLPNQTMDIVGNITGNLSGSVGSVSGAVGSVTGAVGSVTGTVGGMTAAGWATAFTVDTAKTYADAVAGSVVAEIADNAGGASLSVQDIVDGILDEAIAGHLGAGTVGDAIYVGATRAIPWNAAWDAEVQSEVQDAIEANHLDHLLAATYDPASKPGAADALLNELVESDGGVSRYTANALEQAPTGGSAPTVEEIADEVETRTIAGVTLVATTTNLTNLPSIPANWLTATGLANDAVMEIQSGLSTFNVATDRVKLHATQGDYAPAKAGDEMDLVDAPNQTARDAIAVTVESHLLDEGDSQMLINAIVGAIGNTNIDQTVLVAAIRADLERSGGNLNTLLSRLTSQRATNLDNLDATITSRSTYAGTDTAGTTTLLSRLTSGRATNLDNLDATVTSRAAAGGEMNLADGAITDAKITVPAEAAGRPTGMLGMMRRMWEWGVNKRARDRSTGTVLLRNAADDGTLETQTQSTAGTTDTQTKGV